MKESITGLIMIPLLPLILIGMTFEALHELGDRLLHPERYPDRD